MIRNIIFIIVLTILISCNSSNQKGNNLKDNGADKKDLVSNGNEIDKISFDSKKQKVELKIDPTSTKDEMDKVYLAWLKNEIKANRIQKRCPKYGSEEFHKLIDSESDYDNECRFAYSKILKKLYADFNQDGINDALYVLEKQDCMVGNGYVGDLQRGVMILSDGDNFKVDNTIINNLTVQLNSKAKKEIYNKVAYIEIEKSDGLTIKGNYWDWEKEDLTGQPSINRHFTYNFKDDRLLISN
jgi:hypothetical protein